MIHAFPIPTDTPLAPWVAVAFSIVALTGLVALVVQAVRYFRRNDDE